MTPPTEGRELAVGQFTREEGKKEEEDVGDPPRGGKEGDKFISFRSSIEGKRLLSIFSLENKKKGGSVRLKGKRGGRTQTVLTAKKWKVLNSGKRERGKWAEAHPRVGEKKRSGVIIKIRTWRKKRAMGIL